MSEDRTARARRFPVRRRIPIAGVVAVVVATVVLARLLAGGSDDRGLTGPVAGAGGPDPLPRGPVVRSIPYDCGMPYAILDRLAPGAEKQSTNDVDSESCRWAGSSVSHSGHPVLDVGVRKSDADTGAAEAMGALSRMIDYETGTDVDGKPGPVRPVTGLGQEGVAFHRVDTSADPVEVRTTILFRAGNVTVQASYADRTDKKRLRPAERGRPERLAERTTQGGALRAAQAVAGSLRTPANAPRVGDASADPAAFKTLPRACDLRPQVTLQKLIKFPTAEPDESYLFERDAEGLRDDQCSWGTPGGPHLEVDVGIATGSRLGDGRSAIGREYADDHLRARDGRPEKEDGEKIFTALTGLGDRAFALYKKDTSTEGVVEFQVRNALVKVRYWSIDDLSKDEAVNPAYSAAREIAGRLAR